MCCRASREPLGDALAEALAADGIELRFGQLRLGCRVATATSTCSSSPTAPSCAATACWSPPAAGRACEELGLETVGVEAERARHRRRRPHERRRRACGRSAT